MSEKLIPCPICGSENTVRLPYNDRADIERCKNCNLTIIVPFGYTMWNTRPIEDELRKRIAELESAQRWRVVADGELPDDEDVKTVLVVIHDKFDRFDSGNTVSRLTYLGDGKWWSWESVRYVVTHWMPLPQPPEVK